MQEIEDLIFLEFIKQALGKYETYSHKSVNTRVVITFIFYNMMLSTGKWRHHMIIMHIINSYADFVKAACILLWYFCSFLLLARVVALW